MSDDDKIKGKSSIGGVGKTKGVKGADEIGEVKKVEKAAGMGQVGKVGDVNTRGTRVMTPAERTAFFQLIEEEADKLFAGTGMSEEKKTVLKDAVKMAVDAGSIDEDEG